MHNKFNSTQLPSLCKDLCSKQVLASLTLPLGCEQLVLRVAASAGWLFLFQLAQGRVP
jgi:hypothetical protein